MVAPHSLNLSKLEFRAKIDFVTISTPGKTPLPKSIGRVNWGVAQHYKQLTIHDPEHQDLLMLAQLFPAAEVLEFEVAVDMNPAFGRVPADERAGLIGACHTYVAKHLNPYAAPFMAGKRACSYQPWSRKTVPFNFRIPKPTEQLLFGFRGDSVQVKGYYKVWDNGGSIEETQHCMRVEVALRGEACRSFGIVSPADLIGFNYRKELSAYFRMVSRPVVVQKRSRCRGVKAVLLSADANDQQRKADAAWKRVGARTVERLQNVRMCRDADVNQRFGKALHNLQDKFRDNGIVCWGTREHAVCSPPRGNSIESGGVRITTRDTLHIPTTDSISTAVQVNA